MIACKKTLPSLIMILMSYFLLGQQTIKGKVLDVSGEPLFGATIAEKGTSNFVSTNFNGDFSITFQNVPTTIVISYTGFESLEFTINRYTDDYVVFNLLSNLDCNLPIRPHLIIAGNPGLINNPFGLNLELWSNLNRLKNVTRINTSLNFQTNLVSDYFFQANAQLYGIQLSPDYSLSIKGSFEKIVFQDLFEPSLFAVESTISHNSYGFIAGGKWMRVNHSNFLAPTIGLTYDDYLWSGFSAVAKVSFFDGNTQLNGKITKHFGRIATFINYYKLQNFEEVSIGLGYNIYY